MVADFSDVLLPGPWQHRNVSANGARFHVAITGDEDSRAPLVILLHSFPGLWWSWRHQIPALADAGYRTAAIDLRGFGASDKPPLGYDVPNLCRDIAGVIRALGADRAAIVGHGLGGLIAWSMPTIVPAVTSAIAAISAPHPARIHASTRNWFTSSARRGLPALLIPGLVERRLRNSDLVTRILKLCTVMPWAPEDLEVYRTAMRLPSTPHSSLETIRWLMMNTPGATYRRYLSTIRSAVTVPALQVHGRFDPVFDPRWMSVDAAALCTGYRSEQIQGAGHLPHEERPELLNPVLLDWLDENYPAR